MIKPLNIIIADCHPAILKGISIELGNDGEFEVVSMAEQIERLETLINETTDIIVLDYWFRQVSSQRFIKGLRIKYPQVKIIVYTQEERTFYVKDILNNVNGYILKTEPVGALTKAIHRVLQNKKAISEDVRENLELEVKLHHKISNQENKILYCRIDGMTPATISKQLSISEKTVRKHIDNARKKLGFSTAEDMIRWFWKQNP